MTEKSLHKVGPYGEPSHMYASLYNERLCYDIWNIVTPWVLTMLSFIVPHYVPNITILFLPYPLLEIANGIVNINIMAMG
jgi:hypothetical protein